MSSRANQRERVELERVFNLEYDDARYYRGHSRFTFKSMLAEEGNVVSVLLGDKGSGKTTELRHHYQLCNKECAGSCMLLRLDHLVRGDYVIESAEAWNQMQGRKYLFLDSVDECRLVHAGGKDPFACALKNLQRQIRMNEETRVIVSSRLSAWNAQADRALIEEFISTLSPELGQRLEESERHSQKKYDPAAEPENAFLLFTIAPLDQAQRRTLARHLFEERGDHYLKLTQHYDSTYLDTPVEFLDTLNYVSRYGSLPKTRFEFLQRKLHSRYRELNDSYSNQECLTMKAVEMYSQRAAIAALLCQSESFSGMSSYESVQGTNNISLDLLFPDEDLHRIRHFANSTLFISNDQFGSIKFCSQPLRDYAAYLWLEKRFVFHRYNEVFRLLFNEISGDYYPKLRFIVPCIMLANNDRRIQKLLIKHCPEQLVCHAQYSQFLTPVDKVSILNAIIEDKQHRLRKIFSYGGYEQAAAFFMLDFECVRKLLDFLRLDLKQATRSLIYHLLLHQPWESIAHELREEARAVLVQAAREEERGLIDDILPVICKIPDSHEAIRDLYEYYHTHTDHLLPSALTIFAKLAYPEYINYDQLIALMLSSKLSSMYKNMVVHTLDVVIFGDLDQVPILIKQAIGAEEHSSLAQFFFVKALVCAFGADAYPRQCIIWLYELQQRMIKIHNFDYKVREAMDQLKSLLTTQAIESLLVYSFEQCTDSEKRDRVFSILRRQSLFYVREYRSFILEYSVSAGILAALSYKLFSLCVEDTDEETLNKCAIYADTREKKECIQKRSKLLESYRSTLSELPEDRSVNKRLQQCLDKEDLIRQGVIEALGYFSYLLNGFSACDQCSRPLFIKIRRVTNASFFKSFITGLNFIWRHFPIQEIYWADEEVSRMRSWRHVVLAGLNLSFHRCGCAFVENEAETSIAAFFGLLELNQLPDWYDEFLLEYRQDVQHVVISCIQYRYRENNEYEDNVLCSFYQTQASLHVDFYRAVYERLNQFECCCYISCKKALEYLIEHPCTFHADISQMLKRFLTNANQDDCAGYLALLLCVDREGFISTVIELNKDVQNDAHFYDTLFCYIGEKVHTFSVLKKLIVDKGWEYLIKFVGLFTKVRLIDYFPESDYFEDSDACRGGRIQRLFDQFYIVLSEQKFSIEDRESLWQIAEKYPQPALADLIRSLADNIYHQDDSSAWTEYDIVKFEESDFRTPRSIHDLYQLVCATFDNIKHDAEGGDFSWRELYVILSPEEGKSLEAIQRSEYAFQKLILMELRTRSNKLYSAVREPEVDQYKKPDFQIWHQHMAVTIECKIANSWSYRELQAAIETQLIGQYLKHPQYTHGILLLARVPAEKQRWRAGTGNIEFPSLLKELQAFADSIINEKYDHIHSIKIIGIDYT